MTQIVLITGVAGFLGRYTSQHFSQKGWSVIGIDSVPPENAPVSNLAAYYRLDLPGKTLGDLLQRHSPDVCIHFAGRASVPLSVDDPASDFYANTVLTFEILEALRTHAPQCRFILPSSAAVYGNPTSQPVSETTPVAPISPYGFHKRQSEELCQEYASIYGLPTAVARIFSAYGPGLRRQVLWDMCRKAINNEDLILQGTGDESRDFLHAVDIASGLYLIAVNGDHSDMIYNLASGIETTTRMLVAYVLRALGIDRSFQFDGVLPKGTPANWKADISKIRSLGFAPSVTLEKGIKTFAEWCRAELTGI
jgi:UDP-glucose 4-epimerase